MAAAVRSRLGNFTRRCVQGLLLQSSTFKVKQKMCFHKSALLYVTGQELRMPSLSPTMSEGTIVKWLKNEGDTISAGDVLCDIQTDKAVVSLETEEEGILAKILIPQDTVSVPVGKVIALLVAPGEDWRSVEAPDGTLGSSASGTEPLAAAVVADAMEVHMPSLSPTMSEGTIVQWHKQEGDEVAPGDVLCDIQTDKAVVSLETEEEGVIAHILLDKDARNVPVGQVIALMVAKDVDWKAVRAASMAGAAAPKAPSSGASAPSSSSTPPPGSKGPPVHPPQQHVLAGPAARMLLLQYGLSAAAVSATGRRGRLLKEDVLRHIAANKLQPKAPTTVQPPDKPHGHAAPAKPATARKEGPGYWDVELTGMRRTIARRLLESKTSIPHAYALVQCRIDELLAYRQRLKADGVSASLNDFVIKAVAIALQQCPALNAQVSADQVHIVPEVDICVAVATDAGLITPIVKDVGGRSLLSISKAVQELAARARAGKLQPAEFQGGSFTISNLGMFGVKEFCAIINPPQVAILAVGGSERVFVGDGQSCNVLRAVLSYDGRAVEEQQAAEFLDVLREVLEDPTLMAMGGTGVSQGMVQ